ncbi:dihydrofolate reductase family protein [Occultella kanbiaonis]|uniref:dihydrofolate reductase family protein n=1 Tax=Occultella kanbiaonis TaxID=2675754 RepID=UPI0013D62F1B|nr:dihydrofolate reductase family protein [Occultella kanbiaonis]
MTVLIYSATMSLDGFIAGPGGDMSWLAPYTAPDPAADELAARTGALLVGNTTYGGDDPNRGTDAEGAFGGTWHGPQFVLTHRRPDAGPPDVTFTDDLRWAVAAARAAAGAKDVNVLGADVARQCLELGLLDEVVVFVVPVLLGDGVRLFDHPGGHPVRLEHVARGIGEDSTHLRLRVVRD